VDDVASAVLRLDPEISVRRHLAHSMAEAAAKEDQRRLTAIWHRWHEWLDQRIPARGQMGQVFSQLRVVRMSPRVPSAPPPTAGLMTR
jgi:hypothetical protein